MRDINKIAKGVILRQEGEALKRQIANLEERLARQKEITLDLAERIEGLLLEGRALRRQLHSQQQQSHCDPDR